MKLESLSFRDRFGILSEKRLSSVAELRYVMVYGKSQLSYVYPTKDELIPSIGWEGVREGIDDYRYLTTLKQLADKAKAAGKANLAKGADTIFEDVKKMVTMDNYGKAYHDAQYNLSKPAGATQTGAYHRKRVEPDMPIDAYDKMRLKVAKEIEKLSK